MKKTTIITIALFVTIVITDIVLKALGMPTISRYIITSSYLDRVALWPFMWGVLTTHFFWPNRVLKRIHGKTVVSIAILLVICAILQLFNTYVILIPPMITFALGIPCGLFMWAQSKPG